MTLLSPHFSWRLMYYTVLLPLQTFSFILHNFALFTWIKGNKQVGLICIPKCLLQRWIGQLLLHHLKIFMPSTCIMDGILLLMSSFILHLLINLSVLWLLSVLLQGCSLPFGCLYPSQSTKMWGSGRLNCFSGRLWGFLVGGEAGLGYTLCVTSALWDQNGKVLSQRGWEMLLLHWVKGSRAAKGRQAMELHIDDPNRLPFTLTKVLGYYANDHSLF